MQVRESKTKGRHLVADRDFNTGDVVASQQPYASVVFNDHVQNFCNYCYAYGTDLQRCSRSKFARYCCRDHQIKDWKEGYKQECDLLLKCLPRVPPASIRLAAHVAWKRKKELEDGSPQDYWQSFTAIESLVDHWDDLPDDKLKSFAEMGFFIVKLCPNLPEEGMSYDEPMEKSFAKLLAKFSVNNHTVSCPRISSLGCGIYPLLALANHSSWPNCIQRFNGKMCEFRAIQPIKAGEEITITYLDLLATSLEMHEVLKKDYYFDYIPKWKDTKHVVKVDSLFSIHLWKKSPPPWLLDQKDNALTAVEHIQGVSQNGLMMMVYEETISGSSEQDGEETKKDPLISMSLHLWGDWLRDKEVVPVKMASRMRQIQQTYLKAQDLYDSKQHAEALDASKKALDEAAAEICPGYKLASKHILRIRSLDVLRKAVVEVGQDWKLALDSYRTMIGFHDVLYPKYWSERASQLAALARLESNHDNLEEAAKTAEAAIAVLRVTDGSGEVLEEMKNLLFSLQNEIDYRRRSNDQSSS